MEVIINIEENSLHILPHHFQELLLVQQTTDPIQIINDIFTGIWSFGLNYIVYPLWISFWWLWGAFIWVMTGVFQVISFLFTVTITVINFILSPIYGIWRYYRYKHFGWIIDMYSVWWTNNMVVLITTFSIFATVSMAIFLLIATWPITVPLSIANTVFIFTLILTAGIAIKYTYYFWWWLFINLPHWWYRYYWCYIFGNDCSDIPFFKPLPIDED